MKRYTCLLTIALYSLSGKEIKDLQNDLEEGIDIYDLFEHFVKEDGKTDSDWWQFIEEDEKQYTLFTIEHAEDPLAEEISQIGFEFLTEEMCNDFSFLKQLPAIKLESYHSLNSSTNIVLDVVYTTHYDHYSGGTEGELEIEIIGYLNSNKELVKV